ncbi:MAG: ATP-binding protein [Deltaproteobacteria bacterium]|nr:ATP-binding protein [Deltaproteobacteria bacterium]
MACSCNGSHDPRLVVLTGGPGAGKTASLEVIRRRFCEHVRVLPEAATIVFKGGFPRLPDPSARRAAQRAIYHVERELEAMVLEEKKAAIALCDRGTLDGAAYWPGPPHELFEGVGSSREAELSRYSTVIHLRVPTAGYNHDNPVRIESLEEARGIDASIERAWEGHPRRFFVEESRDFLAKLNRVVELVRAEVPECCRNGGLAPKMSAT